MKQIENVFWANTENWFSSIANLSRLLGGWMRMGGEVRGGGEGENINLQIRLTFTIIGVMELGDDKDVVSDIIKRWQLPRYS